MRTIKFGDVRSGGTIMTAYEGTGGNEPPAKTQKGMILNYFKAGGSLTQLQATKKFGCTRLASVIHSLKQDGWEFVTETHTARNGKVFAEYRLDLNKKQPDEPGLFENLAHDSEWTPRQSYDTVDNSKTALKPGNPVEVYGTEIRAHHVSNPDDAKQILEAFRDYCAPTYGKRVKITPDWARQLLKLNRNLPKDSPDPLKSNRPVKNKKQDEFNAAFLDGKFYYTSVGIGFDEDGWLCDGQTRLKACLQTNVPFEVDVSFNLRREVFAVIDSPKSARTARDFTYMAGVVENNSLTTSALRHLYRWYLGRSYSAKVEDPELVKAAEIFDDIGPSIQMAKRMRVTPGPKGVIAMVHYVACKKNKAVADKAFLDLATGAGSDDPTDPVVVARNRLIKSFNSEGNEFRGVPGERRVRVLLSRMFNYRLIGKKTSSYKNLDDGDDWPIGYPSGQTL